MIEHYSFGEIIINGKKYNQDVEVHWSGEVLDWRRQQGHIFALTDLDRALQQNPKMIILGTGAYGTAQVSQEVKEKMEKLGIELLIEKTNEAVKMFNNALKMKDSKKVIGLFHLTC